MKGAGIPSLICPEGKERNDVQNKTFLNRYSSMDYKAFSCTRWLNSEEVPLFKNQRINSLHLPIKGTALRQSINTDSTKAPQEILASGVPGKPAPVAVAIDLDLKRA